MHSLARSTLALVWLSSGAAAAADGVTEINQARALAGAINGSLASDPAGFPVVISSPGSYRLTGNLATADLSQNAIQIAASDVTLDLNGFTIQGPWTTAQPCGGGTNGIGVYAADAQQRIALANGRVRGMSVHGVMLNGEASRVEKITADANCVSGMIVGTMAMVSDSQALRSFTGHGIAVGEGSVVTRSVGSYNALKGIVRTGSGVLVTESTALHNQQGGIHANLVARCVARSNGLALNDTGIEADLARDNLTRDHADIGILASGSANNVSLGDGANLFGYTLGCNVNNNIQTCPPAGP